VNSDSDDGDSSSRSSDDSRSRSSGSSSDSSSDESDESSGEFYLCMNDDRDDGDGDGCPGKISKSIRKKRKWKCPECGFKNCLKCKVIHKKPETCESFHLIHSHTFLSRWVDR